MRIGKANGGEWLRLAEAATAFGVSHNTLRHWSDEGRLRCYRSPGGHRRYRRADVEAALRAAAGHPVQADTPHEGVWQDLALQTLASIAARGAGATSCCITVEDGEELLRVVAVHGDGHRDAPGTQLMFAARPAEAEVVRSRRRLVVPDVVRTRLLARAVADEYCRNGYLAMLLLPAALQDGRLGVLCLGDSRGPHSFDMKAMSFAELMAHHAGILLSDEASHTLATHETATHAPARPEQAAPVAHQTVVASADDGSSTMVARSAIDTLGGREELTWCAMYAVGESRARLLAALPDADASDWRIDDFPPAAHALQNGAPELVRRDDPRLTAASRERFFDDREITALVLAPVLRHGEPIGLIEAGGSDLAALWHAVPAVAATAALAASSMRANERVGLDRRRERDHTLLQEIWLQDTSRLDAEQRLRDIVERLAVATEAPIAEIYAVDGDTARALVSYDSGRWDVAWEDVVLRLERYPTSLLAVQTAAPVLVASIDDESLSAEGRFSLEKWGYQSHLSLPLASGGLVLGLLELYDYVPHDFSGDLELARSLAAAAARILETERLTEQARRRSRLVGEFVAIATACSGEPDEEALVRMAADRLRSVLDAGSCQVFQITPAGVLCVASHDRSGPDEGASGVIVDLSAYPTVVNAMNAREVLVLTSLGDARLGSAERATYQANGWASEVCIPLVARDRLCGFIDICDSRPRGYTEHTDFLRSVAALLAATLENLHLQHEVAARETDLQSITTLAALATGDARPGDVLERLAEHVRRTLQAADCDVFAYRDGHLRCLVSVDERGRDDSISHRPIDADRFPSTAHAVRGGEVVVLRDLDDPRLDEPERADLAAWGFRSEACIPLRIDGRTIGLVDVFDTRPRDFAEHRGFLAALAPVAASLLDAVLRVEGDPEDT